MSDYDALVIGSGLGGVSSAALLARNGFKTLILEQSDAVGGCCSSFQLQGRRFDTGATMVMLIRPLEEVFRRMGRRIQDYVDLIPCEPIYSVRAYDGRRFSMPADLQEAAALIASLAPEDKDNWERYAHVGGSMIELLDEMMLKPANTWAETLRAFWEKPSIARFYPYLLRSAQGVTLSLFRNQLVRSNLAFQAYCAGSPPDIAMGSLVFVALCQHLGIYYPRGGMIAIPEGIVKAGEEHGLEVSFNRKVERILLEGKETRGVLLEDGTEITSDIVVSNVNAKVTYLKMIGPENLPRWAIKAISSYRPSMACPMVYLCLDTRPPLDAHNTIGITSLEAGNRLWHEFYERGIMPRESGFLLNWPTEADPSLAPEGEHLLNLAWGGPSPYALLGDNWDRLKPAFASASLEMLEKEMMPDIREHIRVLEVATPLDFERKLLLPQGGIYGLFLDLFSSGMFRPRNRSKVVKNLYLTGASTGLGGSLPTTLASGIIASDYILRDHG